MRRITVPISVLVLGLAACGEEQAEPAPTTIESSSTTVTSPRSELYPAGAITGSVLTIEGEVRRFLVAVPPEYHPDRPAGLILDLHGRGATAADQALTSSITNPAWQEGFIVVHPQARGQVPTWAVWPELDEFPSEIGFFASLLDHLESQLTVDADRIFVTGFSNGGGMAGRLACELGDRLAGIAPVGASHEGWRQCGPARPIPVLAFHGASDPVVPLEGRPPLLPALTDWALWWAETNGCVGDPEILPTATGRARVWRNCPDGVTVSLIVIDAWGHEWPRQIELVSDPGEQPVWRGATEIIVEFFSMQ